MQEGTFSAPGHSGVTAPHRPDVFAADCPTRQLLDRVADKWSVLVLITLGSEEMRFNALRRHINGISQKMLSQTLRTLERDGLIRREVVASTPVKVSYAITPLGAELIDAMQVMIDWAEQRMEEVVRAQALYDDRIAAMS